LLEKERGSVLYEFTPMIVPQKETKLSDINKITVKDTTVNFADKNPEILTFDELYKRAEFIVKNTTHSEQEEAVANEEDDNLPF
jgi:hypothetical protein